MNISSYKMLAIYLASRETKQWVSDHFEKQSTMSNTYWYPSFVFSNGPRMSTWTLENSSPIGKGQSGGGALFRTIFFYLWQVSQVFIYSSTCWYILGHKYLSLNRWKAFLCPKSPPPHWQSLQENSPLSIF